jgi:hypothetical protein
LRGKYFLPRLRPIIARRDNIVVIYALPTERSATFEETFTLPMEPRQATPTGAARSKRAYARDRGAAPNKTISFSLAGNFLSAPSARDTQRDLIDGLEACGC